MIENWCRRRTNDDLKIIQAVFRMQIDIRNYTEVCGDFVRNTFKQFSCIVDAGYMPGIINADICNSLNLIGALIKAIGPFSFLAISIAILAATKDLPVPASPMI